MLQIAKLSYHTSFHALYKYTQTPQFFLVIPFQAQFILELIFVRNYVEYPLFEGNFLKKFDDTIILRRLVHTPLLFIFKTGCIKCS